MLSESPIHDAFIQPQPKFTKPEPNISHRKLSHPENSTRDEIGPVSKAIRQNSIVLPKKRLRQLSRRHLRKSIIYRNRNATECQRPATRIHIPRVLAVDELELVQDRIMFNLTQDLDSELHPLHILS
jgi:hypothetical protein